MNSFAYEGDIQQQRLIFLHTTFFSNYFSYSANYEPVPARGDRLEGADRETGLQKSSPKQTTIGLQNCRQVLEFSLFRYKKPSF